MHLRKRRDAQKGMTIMEIALVIVIAAIIIGAAITVYQKINNRTVANAKFQVLTQLLSAIDTIANERGGVYPAASNAPIDPNTSDEGIKAIVNMLGGQQAVFEYKQWTYDCSEGNDSAITVTAYGFENQTIRDLVIDKINSKQFGGWFAQPGSSDSQMQLIKQHVLCQTYTAPNGGATGGAGAP